MSDMLIDKVVRQLEAKLAEVQSAQNDACDRQQGIRNRRKALEYELGQNAMLLGQAERRLKRAERTAGKRGAYVSQDQALQVEKGRLLAEITQIKRKIEVLDDRLGDTKAYGDVMAASNLHNELLYWKDEVRSRRERIEEIEMEREKLPLKKYEDPKQCQRERDKLLKKRRKLKNRLRKTQEDLRNAEAELELRRSERREAQAELDLIWELAVNHAEGWTTEQGECTTVLVCEFWNSEGAREEKRYQINE